MSGLGNSKYVEEYSAILEGLPANDDETKFIAYIELLAFLQRVLYQVAVLERSFLDEAKFEQSILFPWQFDHSALFCHHFGHPKSMGKTARPCP